MKKQLIALSLVAALPFAASAQVYVGAKVGSSFLKNACNLSSPCDDNSVGFGGYLGYQINDLISLELGYDKIGNFDSNFNDAGKNHVLTGDMTALTLAPKFTAAINDQFAFFSKIGASYSDYDVADDDLSLLGALGLEYFINSRLSSRLEYQAITEINSGPASKASAHLISIGLSYRFGSEQQEPLAQAPVEPRPVAEQPAEEPVLAAPAEPVQPKMQTITFQSKHGVGLFESGSNQLSKSSLSQFDELVSLLVTYPQSSVTITGHTDSSGSAKFNQQLSEKRAQSVADYLVAQGVDGERISVVGQGEANPIASNDTAAGKEQNRRVEVTIEEFQVEK